MSAEGAAASALYGILQPIAAGAGAAGPYDTTVPDGAGFPRVVFGIETSTEEMLTPTRSQSLTVAVRVIARTSLKDARGLLATLDAALHDTTPAVTGWDTLWLTRVRATPSLAEPRAGGGYYYNVGAVYRLEVEE